MKKSRNFWNKISKSKIKIFSKIEVSFFKYFSSQFFFFKFSRKKYVEHSFMCKSHVCDFVTFHPHFAHQMILIWPKYPQMSLNEISDILKKCGVFFNFVGDFCLQFFGDFDFRFRFSDLGSQILDLLSYSLISVKFSDFEMFFRISFEVFQTKFITLERENPQYFSTFFFTLNFSDFVYWDIPLLLFKKSVTDGRTHKHTPKKATLNSH